MSRRAALGQISHMSNIMMDQQRPQQQQSLKQSASTQSFKAAIKQQNDENELPLGFFSNATTTAKRQSKPSSDFEFEIFQEELVAPNNWTKQPQPTIKLKESDKENQHPILKQALKQQQQQQQQQKEEEDEEEEEQEDEEEEEDFEEDENSEEDDDEDDDTDNFDAQPDVFDEEEEGISRLNLAANAALNDDSLCDARCDTSNLMEHFTVADHSSFSPMIFDDTIKYASSVNASTFSVSSDEAEAEESNKRRQMLAEQESIQMSCMEYREEIMKHLREAELEQRPKANYMKKQTDITSSMRSILVDWLVEVSEEYKLHPETLYLAINYTDRFLSQMSVLRGKLQLVGTAAMYIASKYEEISPPDVTEFVYITDDTYSKKQVLRMEHLLLKVLDFRMNTPTTQCFLQNYLRFIRGEGLFEPSQRTKIECLAKYLCELTLIDGDIFMGYLPSQIAASAIYIAIAHVTGRVWSRQVAETCGYPFELSQELKACVCDIHKQMLGAATHPQQAVQEKYKQAKYEHVALIEPLKTLPTVALNNNSCFHQRTN